MSKKALYGSPTPAQEASNEAVKASKVESKANRSQLIRLSKVVPNPVNPRLVVNGKPIPLTYDEVFNGVEGDDHISNLKAQTIIHIRNVALSILRSKQQDAVEVYEDLTDFVLTDGECRYWAMRLASDPEHVNALNKNAKVPFEVKEPYILASITQEPPVTMRTTQHIKNIVRKEMGLAQTIQSVEDIAAEHADILKTLQATDRLDFIGELIGKARETVRLYRSILDRSGLIGERVYQAVQQGEVTSLRVASELLKFPHTDRAMQQVERLISVGSSEAEIKAAKDKLTKEPVNVATKPKGPGRPSTYQVKITNGGIAKQLITKVIGNAPDINWDDKKAVESALADMIKQFMEQVGNETV